MCGTEDVVSTIGSGTAAAEAPEPAIVDLDLRGLEDVLFPPLLEPASDERTTRQAFHPLHVEALGTWRQAVRIRQEIVDIAQPG